MEGKWKQIYEASLSLEEVSDDNWFCYNRGDSGCSSPTKEGEEKEGEVNAHGK